MVIVLIRDPPSRPVLIDGDNGRATSVESDQQRVVVCARTSRCSESDMESGEGYSIVKYNKARVM